MKSLQEFLRAATADEREGVAAEAGTSVGYLYQLAGGHRRNPSAALAVAIQRATQRLHDAHPGRIPVVTVEALAAGSVLNDFTDTAGGEL